MSAFMCHPRTISRVAEYVTHYIWENRSDIMVSDDLQTVNQVFDALVATNEAAITARYPDDYEEMFLKPEDKVYVLTADDDAILDIDSGMTHEYLTFSNMECFLYQCMEGDIPKLPLFKLVEEAQKALAFSLIRSNTDYQLVCLGKEAWA